jgi:hypothetical protein
MFSQRTSCIRPFFHLTVLLLIVLLGGCVAVESNLPKMEINDLPMGQSAVFIAVTDDIASSQLEVHFNDQFSVFLKGNSINRIYLPEDWYTIHLTRMPQDIDNIALRHRFTAGEIQRFVLVKRSKEDAESADDVQSELAATTYSFASSTNFGFTYMQQQHTYPIVNLIPQPLN